MLRLKLIAHAQLKDAQKVCFKEALRLRENLLNLVLILHLLIIVFRYLTANKNTSKLEGNASGAGGANKRNRKFKENERLFSKSSLTSMAAVNGLPDSSGDKDSRDTDSQVNNSGSEADTKDSGSSDKYLHHVSKSSHAISKAAAAGGGGGGGNKKASNKKARNR
jgi:hypothetical protein